METTTPPKAARLVGGAVWILATLQFFLVQFIVAAAWHPPYNWLTNYISDLGNTACGPFAVPHGTPTYVCSPWHAVMNASFIITGVLTIVGAGLLQPLWPARRLTTTALVLWVIAGLGKMLVGLYPENTHVALHLLGALNLPVSSITILLLSLTIRRTNRALSLVGLVVAVVGLVGTFLSTAGQFAGPALYLGLGAGGMERVSDYPSSLWVLLIGFLALLSLPVFVPASSGS